MSDDEKTHQEELDELRTERNRAVNKLRDAEEKHWNFRENIIVACIAVPLIVLFIWGYGFFD